MIRLGGDVVLPKTTAQDDGSVVYDEGLSEGNFYAMLFAAQGMSNAMMRERFGPEIAQAMIDRGYGLEQLPPSTTGPESQRARVEHALARGLVRDRFRRPMVG